VAEFIFAVLANLRFNGVMRKPVAFVPAFCLLAMIAGLPTARANEDHLVELGPTGTAESFVAGAIDDHKNVMDSSVDHVASSELGTGGLQFDGTNDYVTFGQATSTLGASSFTLEVWFIRTGTGQFATTGNYGVYAVPLLTKGRGEADDDARDMNYFLGINASGVLVADFEEGVGGSGPLGLNHPVSGSTTITTGTWYHAAVTYDGTNWTLYLNGTIETNLFVGQPTRWDSIQHAALGSALDSTGAPQGYFQGVLDEARIWNYARSAAQIAAAKDQQIAFAPGLIGRWSLDEDSGIVASNSVSGAPNGILINGPIWCLGYPFPPPTNTAPEVAIVSPADGATLGGPTNLIINAYAADAEGAVTSVVFFCDGVSLGTVSASPFSVVWSNVAIGSYSLTAVATDDGGLAATSAVVNITVTATNFSPTVDTVNFPADATNNVPLSPTLSITVSDPETNDIAVTFFGRLAAPEPDFTIVALPDTQYYSRSWPSIFQTQINWIVSNRTNLNIMYVAGLGDITDDGDCQPYQWANATNALYRLENPATTGLPDGIPYGVVPGNHDHHCGTTLYNAYFGVSHFAGRSYYGGHLGGNNQNHYDLISAGGMDFVIVHMDFNYGYPDVNYTAIDAWANSVLQSNANRRAIVVSHCILDDDGDYDDDRSPSIYSSLKGNANLFLMLCGHNYGESRRQDSYQGHTVTTCLSDYQFDPNGGNGFLRLYQFSPSNNLVRVKTYSPYLNQYETDADSQFEFAYQMSDGAAAPYFVVGSTNVPSAATANMTWPGLTPNTEYEWYVSLDDGTNNVNSPTWRFTTTATGTNTVPTVALIDPADGTIVAAGSNVTLTATASDAEGFITRVDCIANGATVGAITASPYSVIWSNATAGVYSLTAVAFDSGGLCATSAPVTLTVLNPPPPVASFSASPTGGAAPLAVTFTDTSVGSITNRFWSFGDGNTFNTTATNMSHTYTTPGTDTVMLVVSGPWGVSTNIQPNCIVVGPIPNPPEAWQMQYFGCTDCPQAAGTADPDGDGQNNLAEFLAGTDPTNSASAFCITGVAQEGDDVRITWTTAGGRTNTVQGAAGDAPGSYATTNFIDISELMIITGSGDATTNFVDVGGATNGAARFYRVRLVP
jgi:PKD repeat protein